MSFLDSFPICDRIELHIRPRRFTAVTSTAAANSAAHSPEIVLDIDWESARGASQRLDETRRCWRNQRLMLRVRLDFHVRQAAAALRRDGASRRKQRDSYRTTVEKGG